MLGYFLRCSSCDCKLGLRSGLDKNNCANPKSYLDSSLQRFCLIYAELVSTFIQVEGTNIALFGSVLSEAGTINVVLTATASVSEVTIQLPF
jgi:hypothetical protein